MEYAFNVNRFMKPKISKRAMYITYLHVYKMRPKSNLAPERLTCHHLVVYVNVLSFP